MHKAHLLVLSAFLLLITACSTISVAATAASNSSWPHIEFEKYKLANGLEVILSEDHRLPLVSVNLWYHVGPMYEKPGRTGFAHLFEHMMFQGSKNVGEKAHFRYLEAAGASDINGTTDFDRTNYFETLPSNQLELALWLESDRMGFLLETLDGPKLANQRDVVRNERRQGIEVDGAGHVFVQFVSGIDGGRTQNSFARKARISTQLTPIFGRSIGSVRPGDANLKSEPLVQCIHRSIAAEGNACAS